MNKKVPSIRTDQRQADMFGKADAAIQAQAARDAGRGMLTGCAGQKPADEGLFAPVDRNGKLWMKEAA